MGKSHNRIFTPCLYSANALFIVTLFAILVALSGFAGTASAEKKEHLFFIERSMNKNIVYYDVCHNDNKKLCESNPVTAYWILEGGKKEGLSSLEKKYAFGIKAINLQDDNFKFSVAAIEKTTIAIEKIKGRYRAVTSINNREIVLEKVYVNTKAGLLGMPQVCYIDYTGRTTQGNTPVKIRVVPD
jgi:hypothetical protein